MQKIVSKLIVFFEEPFWVGLYERSDGAHYEVCKITFGAQPRDCEVYDYLMTHWDSLRFSPPLAAQPLIEKKENPKRMQREAQKQMTARTGAKAQQALQKMHEQGKMQRRERAKARREEELERKYILRQEKRRQKHAGH